MGREHRTEVSQQPAVENKPQLTSYSDDFEHSPEHLAAVREVVERENPWAVSLQEQVEAEIKERAYRLYEGRGKLEGYALDDWLQAETEVVTQMGRFAA